MRKTSLAVYSTIVLVAVGISSIAETTTRGYPLPDRRDETSLVRYSERIVEAIKAIDTDVGNVETAASAGTITLAPAKILIGNATSNATAQTITGDVTFTTNGVTAIGSGVIVNADINAAAAIAQTKIATNALGETTITFTSTLCTNALTFNAQGILTSATLDP